MNTEIQKTKRGFFSTSTVPTCRSSSTAKSARTARSPCSGLAQFRKHAFAPSFYATIDPVLIFRPLISSPSRVRSLSFFPVIDSTQPYTGGAILYHSVLSGSVEHVSLLIEADGCDVDPQNKAGDTPLHLAVKIQDRDTRRAIVSALVEIAGAVDSYVLSGSVAWMACPDPAECISIRLTNKARQTPNDLSKIYCPNDTEVISLTTPPARQINSILDEDDIASGESVGAFFVVC